MKAEIERKFLISEDQANLIKSFGILKSEELHQGYLASTSKAVVRVRLSSDRGILTVKERSEGIGRLEFEEEIGVEQAKQLLDLCEHCLQKVRSEVPYKNWIIELDEFKGVNEGLRIAEIEFGDLEEAHAFTPPEFLGTEVTHDYRYYNSYLAETPYSLWED